MKSTEQTPTKKKKVKEEEEQEVWKWYVIFVDIFTR